MEFLGRQEVQHYQVDESTVVSFLLEVYTANKPFSYINLVSKLNTNRPAKGQYRRNLIFIKTKTKFSSAKKILQYFCKGQRGINIIIKT